MRVIADLHVHSRFSRACSKDLTLENNALWCEKKGVNVLGTGDFTHPEWFAEIEEKLEEAEPGLYKLRSGAHPGMRFMMTTEVSQMYKRDGKGRRIHNLIFAPSIEAVKKINVWLDEKKFNRKADGRPILGLDSEVLYRELKNLDDRIVLVPAHAWTPWFAVFGSKSGFDSLHECFGEMTREVFAIETGLSSDPIMNRSLSALDNISLISNSDAHSPRNFGREANVFEIEKETFSFDELMRVLRERDRKYFLHTIEFYPEEGKYHVDGHAACGIACEPEETRRLGGMCKKCGRPLTIGVLSRVAELADRERKQEVMMGHVPFRSIVPLPEIIAHTLGMASVSSKKVNDFYEKMLSELGSEFAILLDVPLTLVKEKFGDEIAEALARVRDGRLHIIPGYDGVYGKVEIFSEDELRTQKEKQSAFF